MGIVDKERCIPQIERREDRKMLFNLLASLRPEMNVPPLMLKLHSAFDTLTEPHR
jgi:hypothetical protein